MYGQGYLAFPKSDSAVAVEKRNYAEQAPLRLAPSLSEQP